MAITPFISSVQESTRNETLIVTNASASISENRRSMEERRKEVIIRNISTVAINDVITINLGNKTAVAGAGIPLNPNDTLVLSENNPDCPIFQGVITAICNQASAIANLSIFER